MPCQLLARYIQSCKKGVTIVYGLDTCTVSHNGHRNRTTPHSRNCHASDTFTALRNGLLWVGYMYCFTQRASKQDNTQHNRNHHIPVNMTDPIGKHFGYGQLWPSRPVMAITARSHMPDPTSCMDIYQKTHTSNCRPDFYALWKWCRGMQICIWHDHYLLFHKGHNWYYAITMLVSNDAYIRELWCIPILLNLFIPQNEWLNMTTGPGVL